MTVWAFAIWAVIITIWPRVGMAQSVPVTPPVAQRALELLAGASENEWHDAREVCRLARDQSTFAVHGALGSVFNICGGSGSCRVTSNMEFQLHRTSAQTSTSEFEEALAGFSSFTARANEQTIRALAIGYTNFDADAYARALAQLEALPPGPSRNTSLAWLAALACYHPPSPHLRVVATQLVAPGTYIDFELEVASPISQPTHVVVGDPIRRVRADWIVNRDGARYRVPVTRPGMFLFTFYCATCAIQDVAYLVATTSGTSYPSNTLPPASEVHSRATSLQITLGEIPQPENLPEAVLPLVSTYWARGVIPIPRWRLQRGAEALTRELAGQRWSCAAPSAETPRTSGTAIVAVPPASDSTSPQSSGATPTGGELRTATGMRPGDAAIDSLVSGAGDTLSDPVLWVLAGTCAGAAVGILAGGTTAPVAAVACPVTVEYAQGSYIMRTACRATQHVTGISNVERDVVCAVVDLVGVPNSARDLPAQTLGWSGYRISSPQGVARARRALQAESEAWGAVNDGWNALEQGQPQVMCRSVPVQATTSNMRVTSMCRAGHVQP